MAEDTGELKAEVKVKKITGRKIAKYSFLGIVALILGCVHCCYVSSLFENDRNFSYLSELEREMSFRTEMGFYYSYYKTIVEERPFTAALSKVVYDRLVEYPKEVNAINRFNIYPEILIGAMFRYLEPLLNTTSLRECYLIERHVGHSPVESCVGVGQPIMFYLEAIWWLAGLSVALLFLHAVALSESILGGFLAVLQYFTNHAESTRVQWTPNERENFAMPLLLLQGWLLTVQLRDNGKKTTFYVQIVLFFLNSLCLLFWQFTQFIFVTQMAIYFMMEQLYIIDATVFASFLHAHFCGLHMAILLLQENEMLTSSLFTSLFLVLSFYSLFFSSLRIDVKCGLDFTMECLLVIFRVSTVAVTSILLKMGISNILLAQEDAHIWDILYSKFTNYKTFHTLIYTCSEVFDFLPFSSIQNMLMSLLIPIVLLNIYNYVTTAVATAVEQCKRSIEEEKKEEPVTDVSDLDCSLRAQGNASDVSPTDLDVIDKEIKENTAKQDEPVEEKVTVLDFLKSLHFDPAVFFHISQMVIFGVMALLVMRLKLLFSTQMCLLTSLFMNRKYYLLPKRIMRYIPVFWLLILAPILWNLMGNVSQEISHIGDFSDYPQEEMMEWISRESISGAFAGSISILATVMLCTRKPIVAHPHYEHYDARQRAYSVYKMYGKFSPEELYQEMTKMKATYLIVESKYCYGRSNKGCFFGDIWDVEAPKLSERPLLCRTLLTEPVEHFYPVFRNDFYAVFLIHDYSVKYMPRSMNT